MTQLVHVWMFCSAVLAIALVPGTIELLLLTMAGMFRVRRTATSNSGIEYSLTVVIPAHDEELNIARCVESILAADRTGINLRVVVVADNCTDRTAEIARMAGAHVLLRFDAEKRGKGHALHFAFETLANKAEAFAVVDADSEIRSNFLVVTARALQAGADATQCCYLVRKPNTSLRARFFNLTVTAYNILRPRGRSRLGFSAGLYGNGFALSAHTLQAVPYLACSVVEDVEYHLLLLISRRRVTFLDETAVYADAPASRQGAATQRTRWEGGRLRMAFLKLPQLLKLITRANFHLVEACLDLSLLPITFHLLLLLTTLLSPSSLVRSFALSALAVVFLHFVVTAFSVGNGIRDLTVLAAAPFYIVWKLLLIPKVLGASRKKALWVRTERIAEVAKP